MYLTKRQLRHKVNFDVLEVLPKVPKTALVDVGEIHHANQNQARTAYPCQDVLDVARHSRRILYHRGNCGGYPARPKDNFAPDQRGKAGSTEARSGLADYAGSNTKVYERLADRRTTGRIRLTTTTKSNSASPFKRQTCRTNAVKKDRCYLTTTENQIQKFFRYTKAPGVRIPEAFAVVQGSQPVRNLARRMLPQNIPSGQSVAYSGDRGYLGTLTSMKSKWPIARAKRNVLCLQSLGVRRNPGNGPVVDPALDTYVLVQCHGHFSPKILSLSQPSSERSANISPAHIAGSRSQTSVLHLSRFFKGKMALTSNSLKFNIEKSRRIRFMTKDGGLSKNREVVDGVRACLAEKRGVKYVIEEEMPVETNLSVQICMECHSSVGVVPFEGQCGVE